MNDVYNTRAILRLGTRTQTLTYTGWLESGVVVDARATRSIRHVASCASTPRNVALPLSPPFLLSLASQLALSLSLLTPSFLLLDVLCSPPTLRKRTRKRKCFSLSSLSLQRKYSAAQQDFSTQGNNKYIHLHEERADFNAKFTGHPRTIR